MAPASTYWLRNEYYATDEEFVYALADALHEEYKGIVDAGFVVQVDDAVLMHECDSILALGGHVRRLPRLGPAPGRRAQPRAARPAEDRVRYTCAGAAGTARMPTTRH